MEGAAKIEPQHQSVDERFQMMATVDCPDLGRVKVAGTLQHLL